MCSGISASAEPNRGAWRSSSWTVSLLWTKLVVRLTAPNLTATCFPPSTPQTANPLLEAFGNAKTIRNNNSSRFGKFIEVHYSNKFTVTGGLFFHYLLEKSRICTQSPGERNYHIFYQLCACLPEHLWTKLELGPPDRFRYLNGGCTQYFCSSAATDSKLIGRERKSQYHLKNGAIQDQLIDDWKCYEQTDRALSNFGLDDEHKKYQIYSVVAAVLHLGNIGFCDADPDDNRGGCKIDTNDGGLSERSLATTARLIGLEVDLLRQALLTRIMSTARGGHKGTVYMVQLSVHQAQAARDALAKAIYSKLFDYIVTKIVNRSIPFEQTSSSNYIGVLDVAGFEYFQHNSFEQFLINFCNEKLQQFFNERILKEEQMIYEKEGLNLPKVEFVDNQDCIQLFECKSMGIFDLLDEESRLPKPSYQHFTQALHAAHNNKHFRLALPRTSKLKLHRELRDDEGFLIRHFAGAVCYETHSFIEKNNDALHGSLKSLMVEVDHSLLKELFLDSSDQQPGGHLNQLVNFSSQSVSQASNKLNFISVGSTFRAQLNELMHKLRSTGSHFIRCIKPNSEMVAHKFEGGQILSQLHCSGMDSVLKLMQQGYPSRSSFQDLYEAYKRYLPPELARLDAHLFCRALFKAIGLNDQDFRFGSSKVFFRPAKFAEFDQIIKTSDSQHMSELIQRVSRWLVRSRWRKAQYCSLSVIKLKLKILYRQDQIIRLQKNWRAALVRRQMRFRLEAIKTCRQIDQSLREFEQIAEKQLKSSSPEYKNLRQESELLREEVKVFAKSMTETIQQQLLFGISSRRTAGALKDDANNNQKAALQSLSAANDKSACEQQLDLLRTKRDLLVRSIKDKIARQQKELAELERKMAEERRRLEEEEISRRRDEELKRQRTELESRRQAEEAAAARSIDQERRPRTLVDSATDPMSGLYEDQERRDYEIALRLADDSPGAPHLQRTNASQTSPLGAVGKPVRAPSESLAHQERLDPRFDLTKWKYSDLRDTINTSCDLELLEACKREFHRRLKVYHAWRAMNSTGSPGAQAGGGGQLRAPSSVMNQSAGACDELSGTLGTSTTTTTAAEQRYFRIPFLRGNNNNINGQRGWWFAHFDGQWIARQLELHPNREPILLVAGQHDIDMCELSLNETRLTSKRGAEILAKEFEAEWQKHGGQAYELARRTAGT